MIRSDPERGRFHGGSWVESEAHPTNHLHKISYTPPFMPAVHTFPPSGDIHRPSGDIVRLSGDIKRPSGDCGNVPFHAQSLGFQRIASALAKEGARRAGEHPSPASAPKSSVAIPSRSTRPPPSARTSGARMYVPFLKGTTAPARTILCRCPHAELKSLAP